jgi:hypothetical protein
MAEMRPEEEWHVLTSWRSLAVEGAAWSEGNDGGWWRPMVVVGSSWCEEVVLGGVVLGVWSNWSKRGWSGLSVMVHVEQGGAVVRGHRGCRGRSWKGRRCAPVQDGAQGGDGWAEGWLEESALGGPGCGGWCQHSTRRKLRWGMSRR